MKHPTITKAPDLTGIGGLAWQIADNRTTPDHAGSLGGWLVYVPGAHPWWHTWALVLVHLRDIPGVKPAKKSYPEAEYEFLSIALQPDSTPDPDHPENGFKYLTPFDVVEQFHGVTDGQASRILEGAVRAILGGHVSPDTDYRSVWRALIASTVKHFQEGKHPEN